ncbi:MAG: hypothetical protein N2319_07065 [Candidatus Kapabacteria bacterium]|nr:hypothetical protein [Candidatus Kapabacteria bacterium]
MKSIKAFNILLLFVLLFLININFSFSQKKYTGLEVGLGLGPNFNFHNSSFTHFEGYPNCCSEFKSGFGIGYSINTFLTYYPNTKIFDKKWGLNFGLSYDDISGTMSVEDFFANIIVGNEVKKGISEHKLVTDLNLISFAPEMLITPVETFPLEVAVGFRAGFFSKTNFNYNETLISPEGATFENYSRTRNSNEGKIPNINPLNLALSLGANYKLLEFSNFKVFTSLRFYYGLTNVVKNLDWKINNLQLGLNIAYKIPKAESIPPLPAPMPNYPEPPKAAELDAKLLVFSSGLRLNDGDTIKLDVLKEITTQSFPLLPIIFFEKNSATIPEIIIKPPHLNKQYSLNKEILSGIVEILKNSPNSKITIIASSTSGENENIARKRFDEVANYLEQSGIDKKRIDFVEKRIEPQKNNSKENEDENYFVQFQLNSNQKPNITERNEKINLVQDLELEIKTESSDPKFLKEITGKVCLNDIMLDNFYSDTYKFKLNEAGKFAIANGGNFKLHINAIYNDISGNAKVSNVNLILKPINNISYKAISIFDANSNGKYSEFILGYFNFNESEFSYIDETVKETVLENFGKGKKIEILPYTDNIGTPEYNKSLAGKRADAALRLLKIDRNKAILNITGDYPFNNDKPHERIYNRSVFVRIYE